MRITDTAGVLTGKIEKLLDPEVPADAVCQQCEDERKDQPLVGMTLIRDVRASDEKGLWSGGDIVDPNNGKVYRVRLKPNADGTRLEVRGYIGAPVFGRTQTWIRVE